ncbi:nucleotidyltransferase domain-containing protein [uncultured Nocardioides sp.]|uniref:nucleotidyltransferase domain-containing protein n=1 Tax=uncultured Nocardioides sp. TaxID=198441 RepID=UPI00260EC5EB|nr:nucleotidyltransferase domain-containing protein [uncultured Nocardioides sp.]
MGDLYEGVSPDGTIRTGVRRDLVPDMFEQIIADAVRLLDDSGASLYVYGSVATGKARPESSDVDLLSIDLQGAASIGGRLSVAYADRCRGVEIADTAATDYEADTDAAYGNRVFLRHYCVHLAGPDPSTALPPFPADARAARGFNGDLDRHLARWRHELTAGTTATPELAVRTARKTLLATAGLVSVHDHTWTTDRARACQRWGEIDPRLAVPLALLQSWSDGKQTPARGELERALGPDGVVTAVVARFADIVGLWTEER